MAKTKILSWTSIVLSVALAYPASGYTQTSRKARPRASAQTPTPANAEFDQLVKRADDARLAERFDEAIGLYGKALKIRPKWPDGWWYVGAIFYQKDIYQDCRNAFQNVVALEPNRGPAWAMLGLCQFQTAEYELSVRSLQRGRSLGFDGNAELESVARYHAALLYIHFEQFEVAYDVLREFVTIGNESPKIIEAFGLTMLRMPVFPKEVTPDRRELVLIAGRAGFSMAARRLEQGREAFDLLVARYPNEPNVHYGFGVFMLSQDADAALKEFKRVLELSPSHYPAMVQMAFEYLKRDQFSDGLPLAERAVQLAPKLYAARNVFGRILLELGEVERSIKELEEGVKLAPSSPEMHFALARAYTRAGRKAEANREREIFKKLQDEQGQRDSQKFGTDNNQNKPKP